MRDHYVDAAYVKELAIAYRTARSSVIGAKAAYADALEAYWRSRLAAAVGWNWVLRVPGVPIHVPFSDGPVDLLLRKFDMIGLRPEIHVSHRLKSGKWAKTEMVYELTEWLASNMTVITQDDKH